MFRSFSNINAKVNEVLSTSQRKTYFIAFATVLFVIVITLGGILPAFSALTFQGEENARRQDALDKINAKLEDSKKLTTEYNQSSVIIDYFDLIFPNNLDQQYIITKVTDVAEQNGAYVSSINFSATSSTDFQKLEISKDVDSIMVSMFIEGNLPDLRNVLKGLEESRRIFNVVAVFYERKDVQRQQQESFQRGDSVLNIQSEVYFYKSNLPVN